MTVLRVDIIKETINIIEKIGRDKIKNEWVPQMKEKVSNILGSIP